MRITGTWTIAKPFGVPVRIHWSVPLFAFLAGGVHFAPGAWIAALLLVLIHEAGHAFVVKRVGARPIALDVLGFGGLCWWEGSVTPIGRACIAWGGVWAQMIVLALTLIGVAIWGRPEQPFYNQMIDVAITSNLWLIGINLLPIAPLDGKEAWSLFPLLKRRFSRRAAPAKTESVLIRAALPPPEMRTQTKNSKTPAPAPMPSKKPTKNAFPPLDAYEPAEDDFTAEARAVIERARAIAREASTQSPPPSDVNPDADRRGRR
ncbi:MAG: hypothetical protein IPK82_11745 [Polyangiaceae bacterium]|nr:hypothetical protein [Polyangiaceae bacterium]